ncbi:MAG: ATPase [Phycisphaerae bacterium]
MMTRDALAELDVLIRARYPIIYVLTWEEERVERGIRAIARRRKKNVLSWSVTSGMSSSDSNGELPAKARGPADPIQALDTVIQHNDPAIYIFKDFHFYMTVNRCIGHVPIIRKLREVAAALNNSYKTLIITAPVLEMAPELEKDITVLDFTLPTLADLSGLLDRIIEQFKDNPRIRIELDDAGREQLLKAALGLTLKEAENVFAKTLVNDGRLSADDVTSVFAEKQQIIRKSGLLEYYEAVEDFGQIGGLDMLREWLQKRSEAFTDRARDFGLPAPKGVLLVGVQGCGKSLCAKAVSKLWRLPLLRFDMGRMFGSLVGSSEQNIRRAIQVAESVAPTVLWADEIDKAFSGSQASGSTDGGTTARVMGTFLTWLSEKTSSVFVVATANDISHLPPELLRKGRLDEIFFVDLPSDIERQAIFRIHIARRGRDPAQFDLNTLAEASAGFSGAEIEQAVISALFDVFYARAELGTEAILGAITETVPLSRTMSDQIEAIRAWSEGRARNASLRTSLSADRDRRKLELE